MLNNFSSISAIMTTLSSPNITNLPLMCENKTANQVLHGLAKELSDTSYRNVIHNAGTKQLIPWLGSTVGLILGHHYLSNVHSIDPHLTTLGSIFVQSTPIVEVDGHPLIDFKVFSENAEAGEYNRAEHTPSNRKRDVSRRIGLCRVESQVKPQWRKLAYLDERPQHQTSSRREQDAQNPGQAAIIRAPMVTTTAEMS
jgi:hypothetical protein